MGILALCAGIPVLSIAYEFKTKELFKRLGVSNFALDIEQLDPQELIKRTDQFIHSIPAMKTSLLKAVEHERTHAFSAERIMKASLRLSPNSL
jgi:colanic acid/amylovoran biosynthesis protein